MVGFVMAGVGVCAMVVQGGLIGPVVRRFGERNALIAGLMFGAAGFFVHGAATTGAVFLLGVPLIALWGFANASSLGLMSRRVGPDQQGQLQGANQSLQGIANLIGPGLFTYSFALAIRPGPGIQLPGTPFLLATLLVLVAVVIAWRVTRP
jgi:DHA1 family tetracycline resistance protein-like MFS transporter